MAGNFEPGKLFVGGLSWETTKETLAQYFNKFGDVEDCVIMKDQATNRPRGFGFVQFKDTGSVDNVLSSGPHIVDKKTVDPKKAQTKGQPIPNSSGSSNGGGEYPKKVFIGGVPAIATEEEIKAVFSEFGNVVEVVLKEDKLTNKKRGFGFVAFELDESSTKAVQRHYVKICDKQVEIKAAEPRYASYNQIPNPSYYPHQVPAAVARQYAWNNGPSQNFSYSPSYNYQTAQQTHASAQYGGGFPSSYSTQQYGAAGYGAAAAHQRFPYDYSTQQHGYPQDTSNYGAANPTSYQSEYNSAAAAAAAAGYGYTTDQTYHYDQTTGVASTAGYPRAAQTQQRVTPAAGAYNNFGATR